MNVRPFVLAGAFALATFAAGAARADTVKLKNGDTLTGTIVSVLDGKLTLKTDAAGEIKIDLALIDTFATDGDAKLIVNHPNDDGTDVIHSKITAASGGNVTVQSAAGTQTVPLGSLKSVNEPDFKETWSGSIVGSSIWTRGNTVNQSTALDLNAVRRGLEDRLTFKAWYRSARSEDPATGVSSTTERKAGGSLKYDYFLSKKLYLYAMTSAERDAIAALDLRFTAGVGAGWQVIEEKNAKFNVEGGVSYVNENYSDGTESVSDVAVRAAYHYERVLSEKWATSFFNDVEAFKVFNGPRDYLVRAKAGFKENFTESFFAQEWVEWNWDTTPAGTKERQDVTYFVGLGWNF